MQEKPRTYIAIDLKSFYASVECVEMGLDPMTTNLVVADLSRTTKTICLAVSPSLKAYGIGGRARLFEVVRRVREINRERHRNSGWHFKGKSSDDNVLKANHDYELDYIVAPPRMAHYIKVSTDVYRVYLKYAAPEDIHVYSIDEVFIDVTDYMRSYRMSVRELTTKIIHDVYATTGITATAGIGTNMYLAKVAMDIVAKHVAADKNGVRIGELDEMTYRQMLWNHRPLTDFWRVGRGTAARLAPYGIDTMGKIARQSVKNDGLLYRLFGVNAELLIDHAWGWEPCTIKDVKAYKPEHNSFSNGQVLTSPYDWKKARVVAKEMADAAALHLVEKEMLTKQIVLTVGYDISCLTDKNIVYAGEITTDRYGRQVPKHAHGTVNLKEYTASSTQIVEAVARLYDKIVDRNLLVRRIYITTSNVVGENSKYANTPTQTQLFADTDGGSDNTADSIKRKRKERQIQKTQIAIKQRFGKNAILKGLNFGDGATARERNMHIGGHKA